LVLEGCGSRNLYSSQGVLVSNVEKTSFPSRNEEKKQEETSFRSMYGSSVEALVATRSTLILLLRI
jgi:hypothetical protein